MAEFPFPERAELLNAERTIAQLMSGERNLGIESGIVLFDLERDVDEFLGELEILKRYDANMPAMKIAAHYFVPVSLTVLYEHYWPWYLHPARTDLRSRRMWWEADPASQANMVRLLNLLREHPAQLEGFYMIDRSDAKTAFKRLAVNFLATRIAANRWFPHEMKEWTEEQSKGFALMKVGREAGAPQIITPGCCFTVSTNSNGLRVFWSGVYRISPNYFNYPTSPVTGILQAGIYVFGVDGGVYGNTIQWDINAVVSLPGTPSVHLSY